MNYESKKTAPDGTVSSNALRRREIRRRVSGGFGSWLDELELYRTALTTLIGQGRKRLLAGFDDRLHPTIFHTLSSLCFLALEAFFLR